MITTFSRTSQYIIRICLISGILFSVLFLSAPLGNINVQAAKNREEACETTIPPGLSNKCTNGLFNNNTCEFIPDGNGNIPWTNFTLSGSPNHEKTSYGHNGDPHILKISPKDGKDFVAGTYITFDTTPGKTYCASWRWGPNTDSSGSKNPFEKTMGLDPTGQTNAGAGSIVWGSTVKKTSRQLDYDPVGVDVDYNADIKTVATGNKMTLFIKAHFTASENSHVQIDQVNVFDEGVKNGTTVAPTPTGQQPQTTNTPTQQPPQNPTATGVLIPTNTPTPACNIAYTPQFTAPQGTTVSADVPYTISWTSAPSTAKYYLRINDMGSNNEENRFSGNCGITQFPGDICADNLSSNSFSYTFKNGHQYALWVQAVSSCGYSEVGSVNTLASGTTTSCVIQGYKNLTTSLSTQDNVVSPLEISVKSANNTIAYASKSNPYAFSVPGNQDYEVSTALPTEAGYSASSTLCINKTDCHGLGDQSLVTGATRSFRCPQNGYVDLWWHYELSSQCALPSTPVIDHVTRNPNGYIMPSIDEISFSWRSSDTPAIPHRYKIEMSTDNQLSWPTVLNNYKDTSSTTYINDNLPICIRITAINSCGRNGNPSAVVCAADPIAPTPISSSPYPTPTLQPTTALLQCYGTQHCSDGNSTTFSYCGNCEGGGCDSGFTCRDPRQKCESYPGKKFYFDNIYPIDCNFLSPTPTKSPLPVLTCSSCDNKNPYLCATVSATAARSSEASFCWDRQAPASTYSCTKCDIPTATEPTTTPRPQITYNPPAAATISAQDMVKREKIGNLLEKVTIQWDPITEGNPKLELSLDGVTWETRLTGNGPYPYNFYSTTLSNSVGRPILVRLSVVTPDGQESSVTSTVIDAITETSVPPTKFPYTLPTSSPISPAIIAVGGILVAVVIAGFMIGI